MKSTSTGVCVLLCITALEMFSMARLGDTLSAFIAQQELSLLYSDTSFASEVEGHVAYILNGGVCSTLPNDSLQLSETGISLPPFPSIATVLNINISGTAEEQHLLLHYQVSVQGNLIFISDTTLNGSVPVTLNCALSSSTVATYDIIVSTYQSNQTNTTCHFQVQKQCPDASSGTVQLGASTSSYAASAVMTLLNSQPESTMATELAGSIVLTPSVVLSSPTTESSQETTHTVGVLVINTTPSPQPSVSAGDINAAQTPQPSVSAGDINATQTPQPSVSAGDINATQTPQPSVSAGDINATQTPQPSVSAGDINATQTLQPSVSAGDINATQTPQPSVSAGDINATQTPQPSVSAGDINATQTPQPSVSAGDINATQTPQPSVSAGDINATQTPQPSVSAGDINATQTPQSSVSAGDINATQTPQPSVSAGDINATQTPQTSVSAGNINATQTPQPSVSAGDINATQTPQTSVSAGDINATQTPQPSVSAGDINATQTFQPSVSAGDINATQTPQSSVSAGDINATQTPQTSVSAGNINATQTPQPSVSAGDINATQTPQPSVSAGDINATQTLQPSVSAGDINATQTPQPSVSAGNINATQTPQPSVSAGNINATRTLQPSVSAGDINATQTLQSSVSAGDINATQTPQTSVSAGNINATQTPQPSVSAGDINATQTPQTSVSAGNINATQTPQSSVSAGNINATQTPQPSVSAGDINATQTPQPSVSAGDINATQTPQTSVSAGNINATQTPQPSVSAGDINATQTPQPSVSAGDINATQTPQLIVTTGLLTISGSMLSSTFLAVDQSSAADFASTLTITSTSSLSTNTTNIFPMASTSIIDLASWQASSYITFLTNTASPGPVGRDDIQLVYILAFAPVVGVSSLLACLLVLCIGCATRRRKKCRSVSFEDDPRDMMRIAAPIEEDDPYKKGEMLVSLWMPLSWGSVAHLPQSSQAVIRRFMVDRRSLSIPSTIVPEADGCVVNGHFSERALEQTSSQSRAVSMKLLIRLKEGSHYEEVARFVDRATFFRGITHPNIMSILCLSMEDNYIPIAVYPCTKDGNLHTLLTAHRLQTIDSSLMPITSAMMVNFCLQIANAMTFISDLNLIHPDLALRNCLLDTDYTVKVGDDALAMDLFPECYYEILGAVRPVRWSAPETLQEGLCTIKSNVWSFGVTMWEVMAMGAMPYSEIQSNRGILSFLMMQGRLEKPPGCKDDMYSLMASCWTSQGECRPHFSSLFNQLEVILGSFSGTQLNQTYPLSTEQQLTYSTFGKSLVDDQKPIYVSFEAMTLGRGGGGGGGGGSGGGNMRGKVPPLRVAIRNSPDHAAKEQALSPQDDHVSVTFSVLSGDASVGAGSEDEDGGGRSEEEEEEKERSIHQDPMATLTTPSPHTVCLPPDAGRLMNSLSSTPVAPRRSASSDMHSLSSMPGVNKTPPFAPKQGPSCVPMVMLNDLGSKFDSSSSTLTATSPTPLCHKPSFFGSSTTGMPSSSAAQMCPYASPTLAQATSHFMSSTFKPSSPGDVLAQGRDEEAKLRGVFPLREASPLSAVSHRLLSAHDRLSSVEGGASKSTDSGIRSGDETGGSVTPTPSGDDRERTPTPSGGDMESESGVSRLSRNSFGLEGGLTDMANDIMANFAKKMVTLRSN